MELYILEENCSTPKKNPNPQKTQDAVSLIELGKNTTNFQVKVIEMQ